jgi:hypothetical protein
MQCAKHPSVETELTCGKCETPICPKCLVYTPVGARCSDCADVRKLPQYTLSPGTLVRGAAAALLTGAAVGAVWGALFPFGVLLLGIFGGLLVGAGVGYAVGEAVAIATGRKAGLPLQFTAAAGVLVAYVVRSAIVVSPLHGIDLADVIRGDVLGFFALVIGVLFAVNRVRY